MADNANERPIIIKKIKKVSGGHHGGAWKVAYADFVTAMMAFFLLLWLLSSTSKAQKEGLAEYFTFAQVSQSTSGGNGMLAGASLSSGQGIGEGSPTVTFQLAAPEPPSADAEADTDSRPTGPPSFDSDFAEVAQNQTTDTVTNETINKAIADRERRIFDDAEKELKQAISEIEELSELSGQLIIDHTSDGMRIQLVDQLGRAMFKPGTADPYPRTRAMFREITKVINKLPNRVAVSGHTDSQQFQASNGFGNWELSSQRAAASRRILQQSGVSQSRFFSVVGKADTDPLFPDEPGNAANRRISITLMREAPVFAPSFN